MNKRVLIIKNKLDMQKLTLTILAMAFISLPLNAQIEKT